MSHISQSSRRALAAAQSAVIFRQDDGFAVRVLNDGRVAVLHAEDGFPVIYPDPATAEADIRQFRVVNGLSVETDIAREGTYLP